MSILVILLNSVRGRRGWKVGNIIIKPPMLEEQRALTSMSGGGYARHKNNGE